MKASYETKVAGGLLGLGLMWGSGITLLNKSIGIGTFVAGAGLIIFWLLIPGEESK